MGGREGDTDDEMREHGHSHGSEPCHGHGHGQEAAMDVEKMSAKEIKTLLSERGISSKGCLEKQDLVARAKKALADGVPKKAPVAKPVKEEKIRTKPASKVDKPKPTLSRSRLMMCFPQQWCLVRPHATSLVRGFLCCGRLAI